MLNPSVSRLNLFNGNWLLLLILVKLRIAPPSRSHPSPPLSVARQGRLAYAMSTLTKLQEEARGKHPFGAKIVLRLLRVRLGYLIVEHLKLLVVSHLTVSVGSNIYGGMSHVLAQSLEAHRVVSEHLIAEVVTKLMSCDPMSLVVAGIEVHRFLNPGSLGCLLDHLVQSLRRDRFTTLREKKIV